VCLYAYEEHGGTRVSSHELGVDEHQVVKTLIMETDAKQPLIVLMHGDREVSTKRLARQLGVKSVAPASPAAVEKHTGYVPGGVSPFGTRHPLDVYMEESVLTLDAIHLNGGRRGFLVRISPLDVQRLLGAISVHVGLAPAAVTLPPP